MRILPAAAAALALLAPALLAGCLGGPEPGLLRLGYFPNLTHAQPLFGVESGLYREKMGPSRLEATTFNAGPAAFEALLSRSVDAAYVGPSPTLNAIDKAGDVVRIVAGSAWGGASLVLRQGVSIERDADLAGKRFATPQLGNTQDVALKHYLKSRGHAPTDQGGEVEVRNARSADILSMFQAGQIDGAWVPEPWATRLVLEGGGAVALDESELWPDGRFITTQIVTTRAYLQSHPGEVARLLDAHLNATARLRAGGPDVERTLNAAIERETGKRLADATLHAALAKVEFAADPHPEAMLTLAAWAADLGFPSPPAAAIDAAYDLAPLAAAQARAGPA